MYQQPDLILERQPGGIFLPRDLSAPRPGSKAPADQPLELLALEDRVLYSAVPLDPLPSATEGDPTTEPLNLELQVANLEQWAELLELIGDGPPSDPLPSDYATSAPVERGTILVVVDRGIANYEQLIADIQAQIPHEHSLLLIDSTTDGWQQLNNYLAGQIGISEIHLFSHGAAGQLQLGTAQLDMEDLFNDEAAAIWQRALTPSADLLLYGCELAADSRGIDFTTRFAQFSSADIAASTDQTGSGPNADWVLEFEVGSIEAPALWADGQDGDWEGLLATSIPGSGTQDFAAKDRGSPRAVAMHSDGSFVMVWTDSTIDGQGTGIAGQRFDADGVALGGVFQINNIPYATGDQTHASIDMDASGRFVVAWTGKDGSNEGIIARLFNADGTPVASAFVVNAQEPSAQLNPNVSMADDGRFVVTWQGNGVADAAGVFARVFNSSGTPVSSDIIVNTAAGRTELDPVVSVNASGNFVVAWEDGTGFYYQRFDALGAKQGNAIRVDASPTAGNGSILLNDDNSVVAVWQEQVSLTMWDVRYAGFSSSDSVTIPNSIVRSNTTFSQNDPSIAGSGDGDFVITWQSGETWGDSNGIYHQAYDTSGNLTSYTFLTNSNYKLGTQEHASTAVNRLGNFVVVWSGQSATDLSDIGFALYNFTPPDAIADTGTATEAGGVDNATPGTASTGNVLANDTPVGSLAQFEVIGIMPGVAGPADTGVGSSLAGTYGSLLLNANGEYVYTVNNSHAAVQALRNSGTTLTDTFTYTMRDENYFFSVETLTITIRGANDAPTAVADSATAIETGGANNATPGNNPFGNVLTNDIDPDLGDSKTVSGVAAGNQGSASGGVGTAVSGTFGSLTVAADGTFTYTVDNLNPNVQALRNSGQTLTDVFTYTFLDADGLSSTAQLTVTIQGANDTPVLGGMPPVSVAENSANGTFLASASATEVDAGDTLTYSLSNDAGGRFSINSSTGVISVANSALLNYELATSHSITVRVADLTGAFSEQSLTINVSDVNEFAIGPISDTNASSNAVAENAANGSLARITALASDADGSATVTYSLDDNAGGRFAINSSTGVVTVANNSLLNFETATSHSITVRATSNDGSFSTQAFTINVTDINEFNVTTPIDNDLSVNEVLENSAPGTLVGVTAFASDADGSNNTITYSLTDNAGGRFAINSSTGVVTLTATSVNYEQATSHTITVRAQSSDGSNRSQSFTIQVLDNGDEVSGIVDVNPAANTLPENATLGSSVITASATHAGSLPLTWSLTNSAGGRFAIDSATGAVTLVSPLNYETGTTHTITIRAEASDGSFAANNFTIAVTDIDEFDVGPITDINGATNSVAENASNGTVTGYRASASDADGTTNTITYSLDNNAGGRFAINSSNGTVTVANGSLLNFEAASSHSITVRATSADGSFSTSTVNISVTDVDEFDVGTISDTNSAANILNENAATGTSTGLTAFAVDPDGSNNAITYSLTDSAGGRFTIDGNTGVVTVANGGLLNYEAATTHSITVRATSTDGSFSDQAFTLTLNDLDEFDVGAITDVNSAANSIPENSPLGSLVGLTASAVDPDSSNSTISYSLDNDAGGRFAIDSATGIVSVLNGAPLDFETTSTHTITVRASSQDGSSSIQAFTINLVDVDEFDVGGISDLNSAPEFLNENATNGTLVGITAFANDADGSNNTISYSLDSTAGGRFTIDPNSGVVTVANGSLLNRETATSYTLTVRATSSDGSFATQSYLVTLNDVDEFDVEPLTDNDSASNSVAENAANGTSVGITAFASDADATANAVTYSLDDSASGRFAIDSSTGLVTVADGSALDFEAASSHVILVRATSADGSFSSETFTISLLNVNEGPLAGNDSAIAIEAGGIINGTSGSNPTGNVLTNDFDQDQGDTKTVVGVAAGTPASTSGQVGVSVSGQYGILVINPDGSYAYNLDNDNADVEALRTASDTLVDTFTYTFADTAGLQSSARLSVLITGANDAPATQWSEAGLEVNSGSSNNQYVELHDFDQLIGGESTFTIRLSITTSESDFYLFSYAAGSDDNEFRIYASGGTLRVSFDNQNWNTGINSSAIADGQRHEVTVVRNAGAAQLKLFIDGQLRAQNSAIKWLTTAQAGGIAVLAQEQDSEGGGFTSGQNFQGTIWDLSFYDSAWSNSRVASETGRVDSTAADLRGHWNFNELNGNLINEQVAGRNGELRTISGSGWIAGTAQSVQTDWLNSLNEHPGSGFVVGTLDARDLDAGDGLTWSLNDNAGGRFTINSSTGEITVANSSLIDRETAASFQITAVATDSAGDTLSRTYIIQINDIDEFDVGPVLNGNSGINQVAENASSGTLVGLTASATDSDATSNAITYTLDNSAGGRFAVNASTGVVTVANGSLLNRESAASHSLTVRATSADGSSSTQSFTIDVIDIDEFDVSPVSDTNGATNTVTENAVNGVTVGIAASAADLDATNSTITYSLDNSADGRFTINSSTGVVTVANGTLLDRETTASHTISVRATSVDGSFSIQSFTINVTDIDEFDVGLINDSNSAINSVAENAAPGTTVGVSAFASDPDATQNAISFSLDSSANGRFTIDSSTGIVTVANGAPLDRETATTHSIVVRATSADGSFATQSFTIAVANVNESPVAHLDYGTATEAGGLNNSIAGSAASGNVLANDFDIDLGDSRRVIGVVYGAGAAVSGQVGSPVQGAFGSLIIQADGSYLYLVNDDHPTIEALRNSTETVTDTFSYLISDEGGLESSSQLVITIEGANDSPASIWSETGLAINAGMANNQYIQVNDLGTLLAGDEFTLRMSISTSQDQPCLLSYASSTEDDELRISCIGNSIRVYLNGQSWNTGIASGVLNDGQRHELALVRTVNDGGLKLYLDGSLLASRTNFKAGTNLAAGGTLVLGQEQDFPGGGFEATQIFQGTYWDLSVHSTAWTAGKVDLNVGHTIHSDPDLRGHWDFELLGSNSIPDLIGGRHGTLLSIPATGSFIAGSAAPVEGDWKPKLAENSSNGTVVAQLQAADLDSGESLSWSLLDDDGGRFAIDHSTGLLTVARGDLLNFEYQPTHTIVVQVTDAGGLTRQETYTIQLADIQESGVSAPIDLNPTNDIVAEGALAGTHTGIQAWAIDQDGTANTVTYSLLDDAGGRFTIDSQTGLITVLEGSLLDREQAASHTLIVQATSEDGTFQTSSFTIQVADVDEFDIGQISDAEPGGNLVYENSIAGTYTGVRAYAADPDATSNSVSWRLLDDDLGRFQIDPITGEITTAQPIDFESLGSIRTVVVEGSSSDGSSSTQSFEILIGDVRSELFTVFSGLDLSITPLDLLLSDNTQGEQYHTLTFHDIPSFGNLIVDGAQGRQIITAANLAQLTIPVGQNIVYEAPVSSAGTVTLGYSATTMTGQTRTGTVTIQVEPAIIVAPVAPPSSVFSSNSGSSTSSSSSNSGNSSSSSNSTSGDSSQSQATVTGETNPAAGSGGEGGAMAGAVQAVGGPAQAGGVGGNSGTGDEQMTGKETGFSDSTGNRESDSRQESDDRNQSGGRAESSLQLSYGLTQSAEANQLQTTSEGAGATRVLASAASIQQEFLATAQFSQYLNKLDSALEEAPIIVGFEMPTYATAGASLFTVGYVAWLIRGGVLLTSFMSSIPSWQSFDPLPILENAGSGDDDLIADGNDTSIAELVDSEHPAPSLTVSQG